MTQRHIALFSFIICLFLTTWALLGLSSPVANAQFRAPSDAIPVTCSADGVKDGTNTFLSCVDNGGINPATDYSAIPAGKYLFVTDIAIIPTRVFTTSTPGFLRLTRYVPSTGVTNKFYEMRIVESNSNSVSFQAPIIRLNPGDQLYAENLTLSTTNHLLVFVTGWLTDSDTFAPTAVNGVQPAVQLAQTPNWQVVLLMLMVFVTGSQYWQLRKRGVQ